MKQLRIKNLTGYVQLILFTIIAVIITLSFTSVLLFSSYSSYDRSLVFTDSDIYSLPENFNSSEKIQNFLNSKGSVLAGQMLEVRLHKTTNNTYPLNNTLNYDPGVSYKNIEGQTLSFAEIVWRLSRTSLASGCASETQTSICFNNAETPMNPGFLLAQIQKESRLVNGACSRFDADTNSSCQPYSQPGNINKLAFRLDRATGYYCFETPPNPTDAQKANSCYDENPNWVIYKGLFKQVYHMVRRLRILEQMCIKGQPHAFSNSNGVFQVGSTVNIDGQPVILGNGMTCATYIYTPHFSSLTWTIMKEMGALFYIGGNYNLPTGYRPKPLS
jgi:hypothetical protein